MSEESLYTAEAGSETRNPNEALTPRTEIRPEYTNNENNEYCEEAAPMRVRLPGATPPALSALAAGGQTS